MKAGIFVIFFLFFSVFVTDINAQHLHWEVMLNDTANNSQLLYSAINCTEGKNINIIGNSFNFSFYKHLFMRSTDAGKTWIRNDLGLPAFILYSDAQFRYISSVDSMHLFVAGDSGQFISSSNAGSSWSAIQKITHWNLTGVSFFDTLHGIVIDQAGDMFVTSDRGKSWQVQTTSSGSILTGCKAFPQGKYFVSDRFHGKVFRSTDYGSSWDTVTAYQTRVNGKYVGQTTGLYFQDTKNGYVFGAKVPPIWDGYTYYPLIVKTTDGGETWRIVADSASSLIQAIYSVYSLDNKVGIAAGRYYHCLMTSDGGETWHEDTIDVSKKDWATMTTMIKFSSTSILGIAGGGVASNIFVGELTKNSIPSGQFQTKANPTLYPNPVTSELIIHKGFEDGIKKIIICDMLGRKDKEILVFDNFDVSIDCSDLRIGMYWLELFGLNNSKKVYKFIKQ